MIRFDQKNNIRSNRKKADDYLTTSFSKERLAWSEETRIYKFPLSYYFFQGDKIIKKSPEFRIYLHGIIFLIIFSLGAIYGVFFAKDIEMEKKAAVYNIMMFLLISFVIKMAYN